MGFYQTMSWIDNRPTIDIEPMKRWTDQRFPNWQRVVVPYFIYKKTFFFFLTAYCVISPTWKINFVYITCEQSQQEGKDPKAGRRRHLDGHQSHTRWLVKWQQSRSFVQGAGDADVIRGCLFLLVVWCRLACIVEMVVAAQQQLSQYYIVVVPFFFTATSRWCGCLQLLGRPLSIHIMKSGRKREATI
jgi:hypothetical protein